MMYFESVHKQFILIALIFVSYKNCNGTISNNIGGLKIITTDNFKHHLESLKIEIPDLEYFKATRYFELGRDLLNHNYYSESYAYLYMSKIILEDNGFEKNYLYSCVLGKLGFIYFKYEEYSKAKDHLLKWFCHPASFDERYCNLLNTLALTSACLEEYDSAKFYFSLTLINAYKNDPEWIGIVYGNLAWYYDKIGIPLEQEYCLVKCFEYSSINKNFEYTCGSLLKLSIINSKASNNQKSQAFLNLAYSYADSANLQSGVDLTQYHDFNQAKMCLYKSVGLNDLAMIESEIFYAKLREIDSLRWRNNVVNTDLKINSELFKKQLDQSVRKVSQLYLIEIGSVLFLLTILIFIGWRFMKLRRIFQEQKVIFEERTRLVELELQQVTQQLEVAMLSKNKIQNSEKSPNLILQNQEINQDFQDLDISIFLNFRFIDDQDWSNFKELFGTVYSEYLNNLLLLYPDLTLSDQKIACLHRLNMTRTDIAEIMGVSADSLRKTNQRMRSRLGIQDQSQMIAYLFKIPTHSEDVTL